MKQESPAIVRYLVLTLRTPQFDAALVEAHYAFLDRLRAAGKLGLAGPFGDRSGGAYMLVANDLTEAHALAHGDPLHISGASKVTVYEWHAR